MVWHRLNVFNAYVLSKVPRLLGNLPLLDKNDVRITIHILLLLEWSKFLCYTRVSKLLMKMYYCMRRFEEVGAGILKI
jgi:hypothetical protein